MTDLVFHRGEQYIKEDLEYYFSGERDIHSQVKPGQNIYSFVPDSAHLDMSYDDGKVGNVFFPFAQGSVDRIYIGISFPLFANSWGAAFLKHLMYLVKPGGCVVLPVYPEMQASEKNYWSRSILENIFISRSRWKGMSNIWAENDGVMSMRIGRKPPPEIDSTAKFMLTEGSRSLIRQQINAKQTSDSAEDLFVKFHQAHWKASNISSIVERILQDRFGRKAAINICTVGPDCTSPLMTIDAVLSPYINVAKAACQAELNKPSISDWQSAADSNSRKLGTVISYKPSEQEALNQADSYHAITMINALDNIDPSKAKSQIENAWKKVSANGVLIVYEKKDNQNDNCTPGQLNEMLSSLGTIRHYSSIAASEIQDHIEMSHYSILIEEELRKENKTKQGVFWVVQK
jgi:hypothetical protein